MKRKYKKIALHKPKSYSVYVCPKCKNYLEHLLNMDDTYDYFKCVSCDKMFAITLEEIEVK